MWGDCGGGVSPCACCFGIFELRLSLSVRVFRAPSCRSSGERTLGGATGPAGGGVLGFGTRGFCFRPSTRGGRISCTRGRAVVTLWLFASGLRPAFFAPNPNSHLKKPWRFSSLMVKVPFTSLSMSAPPLLFTQLRRVRGRPFRQLQNAHRPRSDLRHSEECGHSQAHRPT
jgi:hypothetical protein